MGYSITVGSGNDGETIENTESVVLRGSQHLEFEVEQVVPKAMRLFHATFRVEGEGILEIHHLREWQSGNVGNGAHHLAIDNIGLHLLGECAAGSSGAASIPVAYL